MIYKLIRSNRRTLCVQVINGEVVVCSPKYLPNFVIEKFVLEKQTWIDKTLCGSQKTNDLESNQIYFLGKKMRLEFAEKERVSDSTIYLKSLGSTELERKKALEKFLKNHTVREVNKYLEKYAFLPYRSLKFSYYLSKWGSCSREDDLTFNIKLAMCPQEVIEYVVVHELCHTKVKNHSRFFWDEVSEYLAEYKKQRKWLRDHRWHV